MANAATIAGLAFSNAFVGVNHALAHAVGARFGIAHGRANAIFLPHVLRYNASLPTKFMPAPGYTHLRRAGEVRPDRLRDRPRRAQREGAPRAAVRARRRAARRRSACRARSPRPECRRAEFDAALPDLARAAFADPSIRTNPRIPLVSELTELLEAGFRGW